MFILTKSDSERAAEQYNIKIREYNDNPDLYPFLPRGIMISNEFPPEEEKDTCFIRFGLGVLCGSLIGIAVGRATRGGRGK